MLAAVLIVSIGGGGSPSDEPTDSTGALSLPAPAHYKADTTDCTKVLERLPVDLGKLTPRIVHTHPETPFIVAWGNPPVVFRCGVDRPKALHPGSSKEFRADGSLAGPYFDIVKSSDGYVWTTVDRAVYVSVTIPTSYDGANIMPTLSRAIGRALPAVCAATYSAHVPTKDLCAERK